ncbi:DJ-1/PfpI family protein [Dysgonomonas sp. Marseille-P4677]|uniref:DJ-1/PfpI family protein n=1 Tax=Dysgonomonas sp. Marseille-P4677 TaxID=2364790 RepID=UPI001914D688|nr:DJ-1/PfpI family protein [Dysgonomonas sp. Marseille-P4677]MBK5722717.1 DJ-1/PfpI family protein [Dysgonomonas sp. Marseille-P4677]
MSKKVAVLAVNPVNGKGLFEYLETFFENGISYKTYAVADSKEIKTNSGITLIVDDVIANLKGKENEFDAVVFACGDAVPTFKNNIDKQYNQDILAVLKAFGDKGKIIAGHCAAALIFDSVGIADGKKLAIHPYGKPAVKKGIATDGQFEVDGNFYTAQTENFISILLPELLKVLK